MAKKITRTAIIHLPPNDIVGSTNNSGARDCTTAMPKDCCINVIQRLHIFRIYELWQPFRLAFYQQSSSTEIMLNYVDFSLARFI
nr:hypothetical protein CFP56_15528 [Quercus suber]